MSTVYAVLQGASAGVLAALPMYALLFPVARGAPLPPERFAARLLRREPNRVAGFVVQVAFGAFWGTLAGLYDAIRGPVLGSELAQGIVWGLAAFLTSLLGFATLGLLERPVDLRAWAGHFQNHLVFGFCLGAAFLARDLARF
jgi:hypothetical protein